MNGKHNIDLQENIVPVLKVLYNEKNSKIAGV